MLNANFYAETLPGLVQSECQRQPDMTPVVELRLADATVLDACHVIRLADGWFAVAYFREPETCDDMDICFLSYELVTRITVALHDRQARKLGFSIEQTAKNLAVN